MASRMEKRSSLLHRWKERRRLTWRRGSAVSGPDHCSATHAMCATRQMAHGSRTDNASRRSVSERSTMSAHEKYASVTSSFQEIAYFDARECLRFVNKPHGEGFSQSVAERPCSTLKEVLGSEEYAKRKPHIEAAFAGRAIRRRWARAGEMPMSWRQGERLMFIEGSDPLN